MEAFEALFTVFCVSVEKYFDGCLQVKGEMGRANFSIFISNRAILINIKLHEIYDFTLMIIFLISHQLMNRLYSKSPFSLQKCFMS